MNCKLILAFAVAWCCSVAVGMAQQSQYKTTWISFGGPLSPLQGDGVLYEPLAPNPKRAIGIVATHPSGTVNLAGPFGPELSRRGYRVLQINHYGDPIGFEGIAPSISEGIKYMRGLPGIEKVVIMGASGGGALMAFYENVAENGPRACQGPEKIYPCDAKDVTGLQKPDGLVMLDSVPGDGFNELLRVDSAITDEQHSTRRDPKLDLFDPRNGFDPGTNGGTYSESFLKMFFTAEAAANTRRIESALARFKEIKAGNGLYKNDEPFVSPVGEPRPLILQADVKVLSHTKAPHPLLKPDGTVVTQIVKSVRPPAQSAIGKIVKFDPTSRIYQPATSVRRFLAMYAIRTTPEYNLTEDSINGVDWASSSTSAIKNVEGVTVPLLIMPMSCHYWVVPDEMMFDHASSKDKEYVAVEGALHTMNACRPEYGDTVKTLFNYVDSWLGKPGRFLPAK